LSIVTHLQQSFSEISRLVDAVALPDETNPELKTEEGGGSEMKRGMERLRLMVLAEGTFDRGRRAKFKLTWMV